jgi:DNA-binding CsgD family transcriptional regulator/tetratricopeptide (TPR) repeat protein
VVDLLEREDELEVLAALVERAIDGRGCVALVCGEAGIGKTSVVRALRARTGDHVRFLLGACEPLSVPIPLWPWCELLAAAGAGDLTQLGGQDRLVLARALLDALAQRAPAVAVIEDVHWADPSSLELLRILARRVEEKGVVIVATYRGDEVAANPALGLLLGDLATSAVVRRIALRPLSDAAIGELAGPAGLDGAALRRATGGNPFLVVESIAAGGRLPASVRDAALARAGRLSLSAREAVDAAAVIGAQFDPAVLESLVDADEAVLEEALARGVLVAEGTSLGFRHELIREAIESSISPSRRRALHARLVHVLAERAGSADHALLAHHAELGGLTSEASRYATLAAAEAERVGALRETRLQAERALRLGNELLDSDRFELLVRYSRATNFSSPRLQDAVTAAEQAVALADRLADPLRRGRALMALAAALWSLERVVEAKAAAEQAVGALEPTGDLAALARAQSTLLRMQATAFDPSEVIVSAPRALGLAERAGLEEVRIDVAISLGLARGHIGDAGSVALLTEALAAARAAGLTIQTVRTCVNLMVVAVALRDHELVERTAREALPLLEEYGTPLPAMAIVGYRARSLLDRGMWDEALAIVTRNESIVPGEEPVARGIGGLIRARRGELEDDAQLTRAWEDLRRIVAVESSRHGMVRLALVEAAWLRGDRGAALAQLRAAAGSPATARFARSGGELALWASRYGLDFEVPAGISDPVAFELEGDWRRAIRGWREREARYEAALAALPGDERAAREALATFHRLGAHAAARAFMRERAAAGRRPARGPRRSTLANPAGLTRREQQILDQLATGATNAAIAADLHLSERTVAHHVTAILNKLDAPNRVVAIARARAGGLLAQDGTPSGST